MEEFLSSFLKIDMLGLRETHLNGSVSEEELKINGFQYVRKDRTLGQAGGVEFTSSKDYLGTRDMI